MTSARSKSPGLFLPIATLAVSGVLFATVVGPRAGLFESPFGPRADPTKAEARARPKPKTPVRARPETKRPGGSPEPPPSTIVREEPSSEVAPKPEPAKSPDRLAYERQAEGVLDTPEAQAKLARWCMENRSLDEAKAHWEAVVRLAPDHAEARKQLGFKKAGKRWLTAASIADEADQATADKRWRERLSVLHQRMHNRGVDSEAVGRKAVEDLGAIDDPRAAPMLWQVFAGHPSHHLMVAQQLARLDSARSSLMLAAVGAYSPDEKARKVSVDELKTRNPVDFAEPLIALLGPELKYRKSRVPTGPGGPVVQALEIEDERFTRQFVYFAAPPPGDVPSSAFGDCSPMVRWANFGWTPEGKAEARALNKAEAQLAREMADRQLQDDIEAVGALNGKIRGRNDRVHAILTETTGEDHRLDRDAWNGWLASKMGKKYTPPRQVAKVQFQDFVRPIYQPSFIAIPPTPS